MMWMGFSAPSRTIPDGGFEPDISARGPQRARWVTTCPTGRFVAPATYIRRASSSIKKSR
jgi:hypothetical protein